MNTQECWRVLGSVGGVLADTASKLWFLLLTCMLPPSNHLPMVTCHTLALLRQRPLQVLLLKLTLHLHRQLNWWRCLQGFYWTCGCNKVNERSCSSQFSIEYYIQQSTQASLLTCNELYLVMLGYIMSTPRGDQDVIHGRHQHVKRQKSWVHFMHNGYVVCNVTFIFAVGRKHKIDAIQTHYMEEGQAPRLLLD